MGDVQRHDTIDNTEHFTACAEKDTRKKRYVTKSRRRVNTDPRVAKSGEKKLESPTRAMGTDRRIICYRKH